MVSTKPSPVAPQAIVPPTIRRTIVDAISPYFDSSAGADDCFVRPTKAAIPAR